MNRTDGGRVVHIAPAIAADPRGQGGGERYAVELASHMARQRPTRLVTFGPLPRAYGSGDLEVRIIGSDWDQRGRAHDPVSRHIVGEVARAAVVHCHQQVRFAKLAAAAGRLTRTPLSAALRQLAADPLAADLMGGNGREHVLREHRWEHLVHKCSRAYGPIEW